MLSSANCGGYVKSRHSPIPLLHIRMAKRVREQPRLTLEDGHPKAQRTSPGRSSWERWRPLTILGPLKRPSWMTKLARLPWSQPRSFHSRFCALPRFRH